MSMRNVADLTAHVANLTVHAMGMRSVMGTAGARGCGEHDSCDSYGKGNREQR
jgi:hypothetical protein